ncbi:hypothetical protein PHET_02075 [Paragonimus heterotremus]|uniref:Sex-determining region Y protein n=1 Tax=Paragonimus heterotremus TaxID=100268 RepID=A0A8J4TLS7_9TREM|nr:hypothetical protein PHET_02075 [Paragonimus heterotremus]
MQSVRLGSTCTRSPKIKQLHGAVVHNGSGIRVKPDCNLSHTGSEQGVRTVEKSPKSGTIALYISEDVLLNSPAKCRATIPLYSSPRKISLPKTDPSGINRTQDAIGQSNVYQPVEDLTELVACERCAVACDQSLDAWMDHLGEYHPVPDRWPSSLVHGRDEEHPYTAVVRSQKRRKPNTIPRPLNSFMIFAQYIRRVTLRWFPEAHNVHISQRVGLMWRQLNRDIRDQYAKQAVQLQHLHSLEFPDYKYQPRKRARDGLSGSLNPMNNSPSGSSLTPEWLELGEDFPDGKLAQFSLDVVPHVTTSESQQPWTVKSDDSQSSFTFASDQLNSCVHSVALLRPLAVSEYGSLVMQDSVGFRQQPTNTTTSLDVQSYPRSNTVLTSLMYDVEDKNPSLWCVSRQLHGSHTLEDLLNAPSFIPTDTIPSAISEPLHVFIHSASSASTAIVDTNYSSGSCLHGYQQDSLGFTDTDTTYLTLTPSICSFSPDSTGPDYKSSCVKSWSKDCSDSVTDCHSGDNESVMKHGGIAISALDCNSTLIKPVEVANLGSAAEQDCGPPECMTVCSVFTKLCPSVEVTAVTDGTIEFDDIETCGPSPSLDELSRLVLFETKMVSSSETTPTSNSSVQASTLHTETDGTIDMNHGDSGTHTNDSSISLPSIGSWIFGVHEIQKTA